MLDDLLRMDMDLFLSIHHTRNAFFDFIMPWFSNRWIWIPLYIFLAYRVFKAYNVKALIIVLAVALMILIADQGANLFKNNVQRPRPCNNPELLIQGAVITPNGCGGPFGFFSGHAANSFALAVMLILLMRRNNIDRWKPWLWMFAWAIMVCWSRIYMGVHYPGDLLAGAIFGSSVAGIIYILLVKFYFERRNA